jgi:hypothetical protein
MPVQEGQKLLLLDFAGPGSLARPAFEPLVVPQIEDAGEDVEALLAPRQHQPVTLPLDKQYRGGERLEAKAEQPLAKQ